MDRVTWGVVAVVVVLVAAAVAVAAGVGQPAEPDTSSPSGVVLAFERAIRRGDGDAAWALLATRVQAATNRDRFLRQTSFRRDDRARLIVERESIQDDTATVELARSYPSSGPFGISGSSTSRSTVRLEREAGRWRITVPSEPFLVERLP